MSILLILRILLRYDIIFIANKSLAGKAIQYNTIQHYKTYIHEQHKEMSYIHS